LAKRVYYGGQAVIEGVMMRGMKNMVTAVRRPGGDIAIDVRKLSSLYTGRWRKLPLVRGIIVLIEAMVLGIQVLFFSANVALEEEKTELSGGVMWLTILGALAFAVVVFFLAPLFITRLINPYIHSSLLFNLIEGIIRLAIFIAYLKVISLMKDIKRTFRYHGAEHKTVNAYEAGMPLDVASVSKYSTAHVRCGTSFLFAVLIIAIFVFSLIGRPALWLMALARILLIPVIAALGYEFTYFAGRHTGNPIVRALVVPGLWLQELTTAEPDDNMVEVAVTALNRVIELDNAAESEKSTGESDAPNA
jgi:uncharacterized protein YqhQ